jgi:long-chain acyl-CoA synthetase
MLYTIKTNPLQQYYIIRENVMKYEKSAKERPLESLKELLLSGAELFGDKNAFLIKKEKAGDYHEVSYNRLKEDTEALGTSLLEMGLSGEKIALIGANCYQWVVAYLACVCTGNIIVPLDKELSRQEIQNLLNAAGCKAAFFTEEYRESFRESGVEKHFVISVYEDESEKNQSNHILGLIEEGKKLIFAGDISFNKADPDPSKMCAILFTSGTTDMPKGVMLSQKNIAFVIENTSKIVSLREDDTALSILPIHHTFECTMGIMEVLYQGGCIAFCEGLKYVVKNMQESKASLLVGVPLIVEALHEKIWKQANKTGKDKKLKAAVNVNKTLMTLGIDKRRTIFKSVYAGFGGRFRMVICGAAALDPAALRGFIDLGLEIVQGYGLTETAPLVAGTPEWENIYKKAGSTGKVIPGGELKIDDPDEEGIGEILYKGDNVMLGYYNMPEKTAEVIKDGWFYTGDLGFIDEEGWLYITGRKKNVIVTKTGKNIYPEELEGLLKEIPEVKDALVYGEEVSSSGDTIISAQLVLDEEVIQETIKDTDDKEKIREYIEEKVHEVNKKIPIYKKIRGIMIREEDFIRTTTKKIKRQANI